MRQSKHRTKKNFNLSSTVEKIKDVIKGKTDMLDTDFDSNKPKDVDAQKWKLLKEVLKDADKKCPWIAKLIREKKVELVGLNERVTYHKMHKSEEVPYTHIFDNECILLKFVDSPVLLIYGKHIRYKNKYIEG